MEIRIKNLSKYFFSESKRITALEDVDLEIPSNRIFTLLGPSGCGKTTLLRCIVGLETPDSGEIAIGDEIVWSKEKDILVPPEKRALSMVFQTYAIWPHMNVFDNVAYPLQTRKESREEIRRKVEQTLRFVQLEGFEKRPAPKLSGGQQQRVALARALVAEPKVILFDEPLSNLDAKLREETRKELRSFLTQLEITAVYVTHDRIEALSLSDVLAVMKDGRIVEIGTPRQIYFESNQRFVADFIGRANLIVDNLLAANKAEPLIIVMPYGHTPAAPPVMSSIGRYQSFERDLTEDVIGYVQTNYRVSTDQKDRAIAGLSMGGGQSLTIGLGHLDLFGWVGAFSSAVPEGENLEKLLAEPEAINDKLKLLWIGCGKNDFLFERNQKFLERLKTDKISHVGHITEGAHEWRLWRIYLSEFVPLLFRPDM